MPCLITKKNEDPNAKNGMMTKVWGPTGWMFLHCVTFGYPPQPEIYDRDNNYEVGTTRRNYGIFFKEVGNILPCKYCRDSYRDFYNKDPVTQHLDNRMSLIKWFWKMHNKVNDKLGIKYCDSNFKDFVKKYETYRAKCKAFTKKEIKTNSEKGCVTPADGTPKKCLIEIIQTKTGDITRRPNSDVYKVKKAKPVKKKENHIEHFVYGLITGLIVSILAYISLKYIINPNSKI